MKISRLRISIVVDGGDALVRYRLRFGETEADAGRLLGNGTVISSIPAPDRNGRFEVTVSVRGVEPATNSVFFRG